MKRFIQSGVIAFLMALSLWAGSSYAILTTQPTQLPIVGLQASSGNVAAGTATATLTGVAGKTTYIEGFTFTATGATGASVINGTITGVNGGTITFTVAVPAGAAVATTTLDIRFPTPVPSTAVNTNIVVSTPTLGAGNTNTTIVAYGFLQ